ncbi:putative exocyst complex component sec8 [Choanephora cucurbitarum]|uniref:Exocyst complex component Sec8 n=1 Tax=Choanephora cucurbitarum TaxID=101091 RepID=A0A1C7N565_9FUNG|nr:putative exocyst complex component sec8 [Choanephora cucurbitarum]
MSGNPFLQSDASSIPNSPRNRMHMMPSSSPVRSDDYYDDDMTRGNFSEFEAVLREIHEGWAFMLEDNFDPVTLTLKLMDDSSVGKKKDYKAFQRVLYNLDMALKTIVNDYYKGFNSSIGTFGGVLQYINDSSSRVVQMKSNLKKCKEELLSKRSDLLNLWDKSQQYKEMLSILETIEELRTTPEKIENMMDSKLVLGASKLLVSSTKQAMNKDMIKIGALDDVRRSLLSQKNALYDLIIEELHDHLYLKNAHCDNRWSAYVPQQQDLPEIPIKPREFNESSQKEQFKDYQDPENMFALEHDVLAEDPEKNPETDSYYYIEIMTEALLVLDEIPTAIETIQERLPFEVHSIVDRTIAEVELRHMNLKSFQRRNKSNDENDIYCLDKANSESKNEILKDLLWTLYSKLEAVLCGHRFLETCLRRIQKRNELAKANLEEVETGRDFRVYHFHEIWRPVQTEIRSILQDYLTSSDQNIVSVNEDKPYRGKRDNPRQMFTFADAAGDENLDESYENLRKTLLMSYKKQVPGFSGSNASIHSIIVDKYGNDISSKSYKVLVKPDAYNVSVLLKPTMAFLNRLRQVFPSYDDRNEEGFGSFLDDFAVNVFLPQIEEKVMQLIQHATVGLDAFQDARDYIDYSRYPIAKSAVALISVIQSLCRTMHSMPFHTDEYVRLVEVVLLKFYEKCYQRFYSTVARGSSYADNQQKNAAEVTISTSGDWAQDESLVGLLAQNPFFNEDSTMDQEYMKALNQTEITMELKLKNDRLLEPNELIFDSKKLIALGRLYHTLKWFVREIWDLRSSNVSPSLTNSSMKEDTDSYEVRKSKRWSRQELKPQTLENSDDKRPVLLPLHSEIAKRFDALLTTYQQLAETCLFTLRLEGRCHTMYYLEMAIRDGNYHLEDESFEPDPYIITLNSDLMELDDCINASLPHKDELFAFEGLPALIVHILVSEAVYIKKLNKNGVQKMNRNILALQQNLSNFVPISQCSVMERAREYYQLYMLGSEGIIRSIQENGAKFTFDEYRVMLGLIHDVAREQDEENTTTEEKKTSNSAKYSEWLMELVEVMADYEN